MKVMYSPPFQGQAKDFSQNKLIERKPKFKPFLTKDEYGNTVVRKLRVFKRK